MNVNHQLKLIESWPPRVHVSPGAPVFAHIGVLFHHPHALLLLFLILSFVGLSAPFSFSLSYANVSLSK